MRGACTCSISKTVKRNSPNYNPMNHTQGEPQSRSRQRIYSAPGSTWGRRGSQVGSTLWLQGGQHRAAHVQGLILEHGLHAAVQGI